MPRRFGLALIVSVAGFVSLLAAQRPTEPAQSGPVIRLRAGTFWPLRGEESPTGEGQTDTREPGYAAREYLLQFQGAPVQEAWKSAVSGAGATLLEYVPDFAFRVRLRPGDVAAVRRLSFVSWLGPYSASHKLPPMAQGTADQLFIVRQDRDSDSDAVIAALAMKVKITIKKRT